MYQNLRQVGRQQHRADHAAHRAAGRPGHARRGHLAHLHARATCSRARNPLDLAVQRQRLLPGADARRHRRLHPRRLVPGRRAGPARHQQRLPGAARHHHSRQRAERDDRHRRHGQRHACPARRCRRPWGSCSWPASSTRPAWSPRARTSSPRPPPRARPTPARPGTNGLGTLQQGFVETSNVNVVEELVSMIQTQRAYELNSKAIQTSDQMLQKLGQL